MFDDPPPPVLLAEGTVVAERYRVIRCLRLGGMGGVYRVLDLQTDRYRALKAMLPDAAEDDDLRQRFEQEAVIAGRVRSDHVVAVTDSGLLHPAGARFIVMELLEGEDLGAVLRSRGRFEVTEVGALLEQVALGLDRIHEEGIVHRDLKPDNVFFGHRDDGAPWLKILDFGIAKNVGTLAMLRTTRALGSPLFMAPEQLTGDATIDHRADLYALAHVAFALLVGHAYWQDEANAAPSVFAFCNQVIEGTSEAASERARRHDVLLPAAFDAWFDRATASVIVDRFDSATAQIGALCAVLLDKDDSHASLPPPRTRTHRAWIAFGAAAIAALGWQLWERAPSPVVPVPRLSQPLRSAVVGTGPSAVTSAGLRSKGAPTSVVSPPVHRSSPMTTPTERPASPASASPASASPVSASPVSASPVSASPVSASPASASPASASPAYDPLDHL